MVGFDIFGPGAASLPPADVRKLQDQQQRCIQMVTEFKGQLGELYALHASKLMHAYTADGVKPIEAVQQGRLIAQKEIDHYEESLKELYKQHKDRESGQHNYEAIADGVDDLLQLVKEERRQMKSVKSAGRSIG